MSAKLTGAPRTCPGCSADLDPELGPTHDYMTASPACYARFTAVLAHEYSNPALLATHRLSVDTYAVQHPGDGSERRMVQSVGLHLARLHLARLYVQLEDHATGRPRGAEATNAVMLGLVGLGGGGIRRRWSGWRRQRCLR